MFHLEDDLHYSKNILQPGRVVKGFVICDGVDIISHNSPGVNIIPGGLLSLKLRWGC